MARKPMVTRTIVTTKADVLCCDIKTGETFNNEVTLPRTYANADKLTKAVKAVIDSELVKAVHVISTTEVETLYGMTEQDFINGATVLDPTTRKAVEDEDEN